MALAVASSTISSNTAVADGVPVPYPASIVGNDIGVMLIGNKPFSATPTDPIGWIQLATVTNGSVASGADVGSVRMTAWVRAFNGGETGNLSVTITGADSAYGAMYRVTKAGNQFWASASATGTDTTAGTGWSVTYGSNPGITSGDLIIIGGVYPTDAANTISASSFTATSATFTGIVAAGDQNPRVTTGNDIGGNTNHCSCSSGTASAAPVWTATHTLAANNAGSAVVVRLREVSPGATPALVQGRFR